MSGGPAGPYWSQMGIRAARTWRLWKSLPVHQKVLPALALVLSLAILAAGAARLIG